MEAQKVTEEMAMDFLDFVGGDIESLDRTHAVEFIVRRGLALSARQTMELVTLATQLISMP